MIPIVRLKKALEDMSNSPLHNYAIPGLTSYLLGGGGPSGTIRLFKASRYSHEFIVPHSHRFDFECLVLDGKVYNTIFKHNYYTIGDQFAVTSVWYGGEPGQYQIEAGIAPAKYEAITTEYGPGEMYGMKHDEIHSIRFERGTSVLFLEGPEIANQTTVLEPWVNGKRVPTFETRPWMFEKGIA